jgi:hypothetical protein
MSITMSANTTAIIFTTISITMPTISPTTTTLWQELELATEPLPHHQ